MHKSILAASVAALAAAVQQGVQQIVHSLPAYKAILALEADLVPPAQDASANQISQFHLGLDSSGRYVLLAANPVHGRLSGGHLQTLLPKPWDGTPVSW